MSQGESFIGIMLVIIAYLLYQIAKQLSYLTGKRLKISFFNWEVNKPLAKPRTKPAEAPQERLKN